MQFLNQSLLAEWITDHHYEAVLRMSQMVSRIGCIRNTNL